MYKLFLDDIRTPNKKDNWVIVRSVIEAKKYIENNGFPSIISFDHDLGDKVESGFDLAKWIVEQDLNNNGNFISNNFTYMVHSANGPGRDNIDGLLSQYLKHKIKLNTNIK